MATSYSTTNPLQITINENVAVRAIFRQVAINETTVEPPVPVEVSWRDCVDGTLRQGNPPTGYVQVVFTGPGGGTCWEPQAVIGFEPDLNEALKFDWRRGNASFPEAKTVRVTNPSSVSFDVKITTNPNVIVTPQTFRVDARAAATMTIRPTAQLFDTLADGISTLQFTVELTEVI